MAEIIYFSKCRDDFPEGIFPSAIRIPRPLRDLLPRGVFCRYVVIDRDLGEKIEQRGWRSEDLVIKTHRAFRKEERAILAGDNHPYVTVQDKRTR